MDYFEIKSIMELCAFVISVIVAVLMVVNLKKNNPHILCWTVAWAIISVRTFMAIFEPLSIPLGFVRDAMIVASDILFFVGIAVLIDFGTLYRTFMPGIFMLTHLSISGILYLFYDSAVLGATFTNLFSNPVLLFLVFYFFNEAGIKMNSFPLRLIGMGFLLWAIDFVIFGPLYYGAGYLFAGMCGWIIGFIARIIIFVGFVYLLPGRRD